MTDEQQAREERREHLLSEIRRCDIAIEGGDSDPWWREDRSRFKQELDALDDPTPVAKPLAFRAAQPGEGEDTFTQSDVDEAKDAGATYVLSSLAEKLGVERVIRDGSETWEGDVWATMAGILEEAKVWDPETDAIAGLSTPQRPERPDREAVAKTLEAARDALLAEAIHMEQDFPGDVPEDCGWWCRLCKGHIDGDRKTGPSSEGHKAGCPIEMIRLSLLPAEPVQDTNPLFDEAVIHSKVEGDQNVLCFRYPTVEAMQRAHAAAVSLQAGATEPVQEMREGGWIVANGDGTRFRAWTGGIPAWTEDRNEACRYARRQDAEEAHFEDEDAWRVEPFHKTEETTVD